MIVKLLTEYHSECLSLKGCCRDSSESTHAKMPHCWKSHALAQYYFNFRPCVDIVEEPEDESWYCPKCRPSKKQSKKPSKRGRKKKK